MYTPCLMAMWEGDSLEAALQWANEQAWRWVRVLQNMSDIDFVKIDGIDLPPEAFTSDDDVPHEFFTKLEGDGLLLTSSEGEEQFIIAVDEATLDARALPHT